MSLCQCFLTRILKCENVFGLHRRERIEVQAILETAKNDKRTTCKQTLTHTFDFNGKMSERLLQGSTFSRREAPFFQGFRPWGPMGAKRNHKSYPRTAMVPQRVAQRCTNVLKRCGNGAPKLLNMIKTALQ